MSLSVVSVSIQKFPAQHQFHSVVNEIKDQGRYAELVVMDVTKRGDWDRALEAAISKHGGLDILVNNAGWTYRRKNTLTVTDEEYDSKSGAPEAAHDSNNNLL